SDSTNAGTSLRALRSASAWALPRPSAIASAKLANSTVNHSDTEIAAMKPGLASPAPVASAWTSRIVVNRLPISTTNMTGLRIMRRGSSLPNASRIARRTIRPSSSGRSVTRGWLDMTSSGSRMEHEVLGDGPQRQGGHERQRADQQHHADEQRHEQRAGGRQGPRRRRHDLLAGERA